MLPVWNGLILLFPSPIVKSSCFSRPKTASRSENLLIWYKPAIVLSDLIQRGWSISHEGYVSFPPPAPTSISPTDDGSMSEIPASIISVGGLGALYTVGAEKILQVGLGYATELEKVI